MVEPAGSKCDGTAFTTYAKGIHDCPDAAACDAQCTGPRGETSLVPRELARGSAQDADAERHAAAGTPEGEVSLDPAATFGINWLDTETDPQLARVPLQRRRRYRWFKQDGHIYRVADTTAGARTLERVGRNKFHFGGQLMMVSDDLFHAPLAIFAQAADVQEAANYEDIYAKTSAAVGDPYTVTFDRGLHLKRIFEPICVTASPRSASGVSRGPACGLRTTSVQSSTGTASLGVVTAATPATSTARAWASSSTRTTTRTCSSAARAPMSPAATRLSGCVAD